MDFISFRSSFFTGSFACTFFPFADAAVEWPPAWPLIKESAFFNKSARFMPNDGLHLPETLSSFSEVLKTKAASDPDFTRDNATLDSKEPTYENETNLRSICHVSTLL